MKLTDILSEIKVKPAISIPSPEEAWRMYLDEEFGPGYISVKPLKFLGYQLLANDSVIVYYFKVKAANTFNVPITIADTSSWLKQIYFRFNRGTSEYKYESQSNYDINDPMWQNIIKTQLTK
jgi:hypothetical protein